MTDGLYYFETVTYPRIWGQAYDLGRKAYEAGLPRVCNLTGSPYCYISDGVEKQLKVYKSAWEQGYDNYKIPDIFQQVENNLKNIPTMPMQESDI